MLFRSLGTTESSIQREGANRILVEAPGIADPQRLKEIIGKTAQMTFHLVGQQVRSEEAANWAQHFHWLEHEVDAYQARLLGGNCEQFARWINEGRFVLGRELADLGYAQMLDV